MPQLIMLNHASWVNRKNSERKSDAKREREKNRDGYSTAEERRHAEEIKNYDSSKMSNYFGGFE